VVPVPFYQTYENTKTQTRHSRNDSGDLLDGNGGVDIHGGGAGVKDECLKCELPVCSDKDERCPFVQITREVKRESYKSFYARHREQEIARVAKWVEENRERRNAYLRERYRLSKEQA